MVKVLSKRCTFNFTVGLNWVLAILLLLNNAETLRRGEEIQQSPKDDAIFYGLIRANSAGHLEVHDRDKAESVIGPRIIHTHLPLSYFKKAIETYPNLKVIQTIRNFKDTLVSFYNFYRMEKRLGAFNGSWDDYFKLVENKELAFGDYFDYYSEW